MISIRDSHENNPTSFDVLRLHAAQQQTIAITHAVAALFKPGITESQAEKTLIRALREAGVKHFWHPVHIRFGRNTLLGYREKSNDDLVLQPQDIFFIDIGPVFNGYEGDYGTTFVVGENTLYHQAMRDVCSIWQQAATYWKTHQATGQALYEFIRKTTVALGWHFSPEYVGGHRLSEFPHRLTTTAHLAAMEFTPSNNLWVLEVQIRHPNLPFGAFYENILSSTSTQEEPCFV